MVRRAHVRDRAGAGDRRAELQTFKDFPPRQKPGSFSVGDALDKLMSAEHSSN